MFLSKSQTPPLLLVIQIEIQIHTLSNKISHDGNQTWKRHANVLLHKNYGLFETQVRNDLRAWVAALLLRLKHLTHITWPTNRKHLSRLFSIDAIVQLPGWPCLALRCQCVRLLINICCFIMMFTLTVCCIPLFLRM